MYSRKVQITGKDSSIITLPKKWVKQQNVQKNAQITFFPMPTGDLLLRPHDRNPVLKDIVVNVTEPFNSDQLYKQLLSGYLSGFCKITVQSRTRFTTDMRGVIEKCLGDFKGFEIMGETTTSIMLRDLIKPEEIDFTMNLGRMVNLIDSTLLELPDMLESQTKENITRLERTSVEIVRIKSLIAHHSARIMRDPVIPEVQVSPLMTVVYFMYATYLEEFNTITKECIQRILHLSSNAIFPSVKKSVLELNSTAISILDEAHRAWTREGVFNGDNFNVLTLGLKERCNAILSPYKDDAPSPLVLVLDSFQKIADSLNDLALTAQVKALCE